MVICLDTVRQIQKTQISVLSYHTPEKQVTVPAKKVFGLAPVVGVFVVAGILYFVVSNLNSSYGNTGLAKNREIIATSMAKSTTTILADQNITKEVQITGSTIVTIPIKVAPQKVLVTTHGGFEDIYASAEKKYGVSRYLLAAIHMVETGQSGSTSVQNPSGATGPMQIMPKTFAAYAQDGNGDGTKSIDNVYDSIYTAANYLAANDAASGNVAGALYRYNHHDSYVNKVLALARSLGYQG